jgi:ectoine hydroxylase-related dioxygenase (phytanoyl-CoA dioxygenase family)
VLGALAALSWLGALLHLATAFSNAVETTGSWVRRGGRSVRDVAVAWLSVPVALSALVLATLLMPVFLIRGLVSLAALLRERDRALELRRAAVAAASARAVFVSYRTTEHAADAQAVSQALQAAGVPAWLDAERGTLPTQLFFVDRVIEDAVRSARGVVILHAANGEGTPYAESRLDRVDRGLATALRWTAFAPLAFYVSVMAVLALPLAPLLVASQAHLGRVRWIVPPSVRARWYRKLCGTAVERRPGERWHAWEQRLARLYGLPTITVAVMHDLDASRPEVDVVLRRPALDRDVRSELLPKLTAARPDPTAPLALAQAQIGAARAAARTHPFRTVWWVISGGYDGMAGLLRKLAGDGEAAEAFEREGYAVLGGFLDATEVAELREAIDQALTAPRAGACARPHHTLLPLRWDDAIVDRVLRDNTRRLRLAAVTGGADVRWISGYISIKAPHSQALSWHQDWWCWDHPVSYEPRAAQVAVLCHLTATDAERAALRVLPGSHRERRDLHAVLPEAHAEAASDLDPPHRALANQPDQVTLALSRGDAVVLDYRLLQGMHPNRTGERRDCVLLTFAPSWRALPKEIRDHLIQHPALPVEEEHAERPWLPAYDGPRGDLPLNRTAYSTRIHARLEKCSNQ